MNNLLPKSIIRALQPIRAAILAHHQSPAGPKEKVQRDEDDANEKGW